MEANIYHFYRCILAVLFTLSGALALAQEQLNVKVFNQTNTSSLPTNVFQRVEVDGKGHVWVGTNGLGLVKFSPEDSSWTRAITNHQVRAISKDSNGNIWVGSGSGGIQAIGGGIRKFIQGDLSSFTYWGATTGALNRYVNGLAEGHNNTIWAAHGQTITSAYPDDKIDEGGVGWYDGNVWNKITQAGMPASDRRVLSVAKVGGNMWVGVDRSCINGTCTAPYIAEYSAAGTFIKKVSDSLPFVNVVGGPLPRSIYHDSKNRTWVGLSSGDGVVAVYENSSWTIVSNSITKLPAGTAVNFQSIKEDSSGNIWIGTSNGLLNYYGNDYKLSSTWTLFTVDNGLPANFINGVSVDGDNNKWLSTSAGVVKVIPNKQFEGVINDLSANLVLGNNSNLPLANADLKIFDGTRLIAGGKTTTSGNFKIDVSGIDLSRNYTFQIEQGEVLKDRMTLKLNNVDLSQKLEPIRFPYRLRKQVIEGTQKLKASRELSLNAFGGVLPPLIIKGYSDNGLNNFIADYESAVDDGYSYTKAIDPMNRVVLGLYAFDEYYRQSLDISEGTIGANADVAFFMYHLLQPSKDIKDLGQKKTDIILRFVRTSSRWMFDYLVEGYVNEVITEASKDDPLLGTSLTLYFEAIKKFLYDYDFYDPSANNMNVLESAFKEAVITAGAYHLIDGYYHPKSQEILDKLPIQAKTPSGEFATATLKVKDQLEESLIKTDDAVAKAENYKRSAAIWGNLSEWVSSAADLRSLLKGGAGKEKLIANKLTIIANLIKTMSFTSYYTAAEFYNERYTEHFKEMEIANSTSTQARLSTGELANQSSKGAELNELEKHVLELNALLTSTKSEIDVSSSDRLSGNLQKILDQIYLTDKSLKNTSNYFRAVGANAELKIDNYKAYKEQTVHHISNYNLAKSVLSNLLLGYLYDDTNNENILAIKNEIELFTSNNIRLLDHFNNVASLTATIPAEILIAAKDFRHPDVINKGSSFQMKFNYKNFGSIPAGSFSVIVEGSKGISVGNSMISVPGLAAGAEEELIIDVFVGDNVQNPFISITFGGINSLSEMVIFEVAEAKQSQTIVFNTIPNKTFGIAPFEIEASATSGLPVKYSIISGPATLVGNLITIIGEGTVVVKAEQEGNNDYNAAEITVTFCVVPAKPTLTQEESKLNSSSPTGNQWYFNGTAIEGATSQAYTATETGIYTVQVSGSCGLSEMSEAVTYNVTSVEDELAQAIQIYPNPATEALFVDLPNNILLEGVALYNAQGKVLIIIINGDSKNKVKLNVRNYAKGLHILQIQTDKGIIYKKVVLK